MFNHSDTETQRSEVLRFPHFAAMAASLEFGQWNFLGTWSLELGILD
jgi:hypothetical protein